MTTKRKSSAGSALIQTLGLVLITLMVSAVSVDFGFYYAAQNQLRTAAESASLSAVSELYNSSEGDPELRRDEAATAATELADENWSNLTIDTDDIIWGFIDPQTKTYDPATFATPTADTDYAFSGGYNAVRVVARKTDESVNGPLPTIMANMFGVSQMNAQAAAVAIMDDNIGSINNGGLRPIYACEGLLDVAFADGDISNDTIRIYGDTVYVNGVTVVNNCPAPGSGNWGFADLRDCNSGAVGVSTLREWWGDGYEGTVDAGECYSTQPGNPIASIRDELDTLIADETVFPIPLYDGWGGSGSNTHVDISGFVGFQISSYQATGAQANRYIEGHFSPYVCKQGCSTGNGQGDAPGGAIVKLRLAGR